MFRFFEPTKPPNHFSLSSSKIDILKVPDGLENNNQTHLVSHLICIVIQTRKKNTAEGKVFQRTGDNNGDTQGQPPQSYFFC